MSHSKQVGNNIAELFGAAQQRVRQGWERCRKAVESCDREIVRTSFFEFEADFRRQIKLEEEILFPALALQADKLEADPTILMRAEHRAIEQILDELAARVGAGDCAALYGQHVGPSALFHDHLIGEENVLYPIADLVIPAEKRAEILSLARAATANFAHPS